MASRIETQALRLVDQVHAATGGRPQQWRSLMGLSGATDEAVQHAVDQGWLLIEGGHSVCLTDEGRKLAKD